MSARGRMTMRAAIERNSAAGTDDYGHGVTPVFAAHATIACFVWSTSRRTITDGDKEAVVEDLMAMFPAGADINEDDEISSVADRQGNELLSGRFRIEGLQARHGHIEASLLRVQ